MSSHASILVVGDVPHSDAVSRADLDPPAALVQAASFAEFEEELANSEPWLVLTAASVEQDITGTDVVRRAKAHCDYLPTIMVAQPAQVDVVAQACQLGLDEHLIVGEDRAANARLLVRLVRRCLENYTPEASTLGPTVQIALHQAIYYDIDESVVLVNKQGRILYFNHKAQELADALYGATLVVGAPILNYVPEGADEEFLAMIRNLIDQAFAGEEVLVCEPLDSLGQDAMVREFRYAPVYGPDGDVIAVAANSRDRKEVLEAREKLEASEARFWEFFENLPVGVGIIDRDGEWTRVNSVLEKILGYSEEELVGSSPVDCIHPDDAERAAEEIMSLVNGEERLLKHQKRMIHRDGHDLWTDVTAMAIGPDDEPARRFIGIITDVTRQKRLEEQLQETEKMRVIGQLAGGVAHDFNNLLTIINSYTYYALNELGEDSRLAFALEKVNNAASRGSKLVDQLLAFSRRKFTEPAELDVNQVIEEFEDVIRRITGQDIELECELGSDAGAVWIDRSQLEQVILNLAFNACDAMAEGGTLTLRTRHATLDSSIIASSERVPPGEYEVIEVADTGSGIDEATVERIFEPFFTTKEVGKGTGLGLSSTWGTVKQAGGFIDVESELGEGSTFRIYLPSRN